MSPVAAVQRRAWLSLMLHHSIKSNTYSPLGLPLHTPSVHLKTRTLGVETARAWGVSHATLQHLGLGRSSASGGRGSMGLSHSTSQHWERERAQGDGSRASAGCLSCYVAASGNGKELSEPRQGVFSFSACGPPWARPHHHPGWANVTSVQHLT